MGKCRRQQSITHHRSDIHLSDGFHPHTGEFLLYGTYHRTAPGRDEHQRKYSGTDGWHVRLRLRTGVTVHTLCPLPYMDETDAEVRFMDGHDQSCAGLHRTGFLPEIPIRGRPRLRLAHT